MSYGSSVYACTRYIYIHCSFICAGTRARVKKAPSFVVELGSDNFNSVVMDPTKNVLVEFYAPCKTASVVGNECGYISPDAFAHGHLI